MDHQNSSEQRSGSLAKDSLADRFGAGLRRPAPLWMGAPMRATIGWMLLAIGLAAGILALGAARQAAAARAGMNALLLAGEGAARDRERAIEIGHALARPPLDATLGLLRAHLPPDIRLIEAAQSEDGALALAIDTPDPDALRAALAADARLARFRERGQEVRDDGTIRVRLSGEIR